MAAMEAAAAVRVRRAQGGSVSHASPPPPNTLLLLLLRHAATQLTARSLQCGLLVRHLLVGLRQLLCNASSGHPLRQRA